MHEMVYMAALSHTSLVIMNNKDVKKTSCKCSPLSKGTKYCQKQNFVCAGFKSVRPLSHRAVVSVTVSVFVFHLLSFSHIHMFSQRLALSQQRVEGDWVGISLYTSENWPNSPNYGITWANLIHHCNYLASAPSHTQAHTNTHLLWQQKVLI